MNEAALPGWPSCLQFALFHVESENHCLICAACFRQSWRLHWTKGWFTSGPRSTDLHWKPRMGWPIGWPLMKEPIWRRWAKSLSIRPCWEWLSGRFRVTNSLLFFFSLFTCITCTYIFHILSCQDDIHNPWTLGSTKNSVAKCPGRPSRNYEYLGHPWTSDLVGLAVEVVNESMVWQVWQRFDNGLTSAVSAHMLCISLIFFISSDLHSFISDPRHALWVFCSRCFHSEMRNIPCTSKTHHVRRGTLVVSAESQGSIQFPNFCLFYF